MSYNQDLVKGEYTPMEDSSGEPKAQIQKIHQEGSKSTYVIIVNKDCLKSDSALRNIANIKQAPVTSRGRSVPRRNLVHESDVSVRRNLSNISDKDFDSPADFSTRELSKCRATSEDVKLNLMNISDEQYDSGMSSSSIFLKSENSSLGYDSAIDTDFSHSLKLENSSNSIRNSKQKLMNSYVIPSPLAAQRKGGEIQHTFPVISTTANIKNASSKLACNTSVLTNKTASNQVVSRRIVLATDSNTAPESVKDMKRTVHYTSQAVPVANNNLGTPVSIGYQRPLNPNAVPVFSDISPIQAAGDSKLSPLSLETVQPLPQSNCAGDNKGPLTSTPVGCINPRISHLKKESSSHRPVYVIPSPFTRQKSDDKSIKANNTASSVHSEDLKNTSSDVSGSGGLNNSSGFVSANASLEQTDSSTSIQITDVRSLKKSKIDPRHSGANPSCSSPVSAEIGVLPVDSTEIDNGDDGETDLGVGTDTEADPCSSQESDTSEKYDKSCLNRSLTNMQWLKGMQLKEEKTQSSSNSSSSHSQHQTIQWKCLTPEDIKQISEECGREKRPPFSYMSLIQMALYSREDRKMMLKEICKWIEDTFPYYRYCGKQGWKNSIRHNLSLYNIFVREPAKRHGAYWTIKPNLEPKTKQYKDRHSGSASASSDTHQSMPSLPTHTPGMIPIIPMYSSMGQLAAISPQSLLTQPQATTATGSKKKGPPPILPRPSPYGATSPYAPQAYALIPLQSVSQSYSLNQGIPQSPMIVNLPNTAQSMSACPSPLISEMSAAVASIQVSCASPIPPESLENPLNFESVIQRGPVDMVKQAWTDTRSMDSCSSFESDLTSSNDIASSSEFTCNSVSRAKAKRPRDGKPGLPKPKIYRQESNASKKAKGSSKRRKLQQRERALQESSDEDDDGTKFLSKLEKDLTTPLKLLATSDNVAEELLATSTPLKNTSNGSPQLPSPIQGLTPLRSAGLFDGSFIDMIDKKAMSPDLGAKKYSPDTAIKLSPNTSLDFSVLDKCNDSPDSNTSLTNQNLSRFLNEYCLDPNLAESAENFPNLNWSVVQQMVDNMVTDQN